MSLPYRTTGEQLMQSNLNTNQGHNSSSSRRKQNTIIPINPSSNCLDNIKNYIAHAKKIHGPIFDNSVDWNSHIWNIKGFESTVTTRSVTHACNIIYTQDNNLGKKIKSSRENEIPFSEPFATEVKAFITHRHNKKPCKHDSHMVIIRAFRYLYLQMSNTNTPSFSLLKPAHFDEAIRYALQGKQEAESTLCVTGERLAYIADELDRHKLTPTPLDWKNPIPRNERRGGASHNRGTKKAQEERAKKLPKTQALIFLSALWANFDSLEEKDKALVCMSVILLIAGFRMDEFVALDINCIPSRAEYDSSAKELDPQTGSFTKLLRIRALAKKKNHWDEKIIPRISVDVIYEAVSRLEELSAPHRRTAKMLLNERRWDKFSIFDDDQILSAREIQLHLNISGRSTSNTISILERRGIERCSDSKSGGACFRVGDIHEAFSDEYINRIGSIKNGLGDTTLNIPIYNFLTLRYLDQYTPKEKLNVFPEPLTGTHIQDFFRGRDYKTREQISGRGGEAQRVLSVFERYDFPELGEIKDTIRTHQFRHLLNTIMQESDMFSQEDIAKNFLRKNAKDNSSYNHQISPIKFAERTRDFQSTVLKKLNIDEQEAKNVIQRFPLLSYEDLQKDLDESGSYHFMDIGRCRHDYTQSPCGMHYMCLRECIHYKRTKGDVKEVEKITQRRDRALMQMNLAKEDADDNFTNANNWYLNHLQLVNGCNQALAIEDNPQYLNGEIVQIFPNGVDCCEETNDE